MKGLSLANFKKMKETKDWATLIHKDGHTINIAKAPLSPIQRKQLEKLEMHEVHQYAEGTSDAGSEDASPPPPNSESQPSELQGIMNDVASNTPENAAVPETNNGQAQSPPPPASPAQSIGQAQNAGLSQEQAGNTALAQAQAKEGSDTSAAYDTYQKDIAKLPSQNDLIQKNSINDAVLEKRFEDKTIDPDHYFDNHSKIAAGIGILLGGLGQGIGQGRVQGNQALETLQAGINRDIDAQKANQGQALTLWQMNRQALGNDLAANLATQNQMYTALQAKINQTAASAQKPIAFANAQINNSKIQQIKDANNFKLALLQPSSDNPNPASRIQFLTTPDNKQLVPLATNEISAAQHINSNAPAIIDAHMQSWDDTGPGVKALRAALPYGAPTPGQARESQLLGNTVVAETDSGRQAEFENVRHNIVNGLSDTASDKGSKLNTLIDYLSSKSTAAPASRALGLDLTKFPSTNTTRQQLINYVAQKYPDKLQYLQGGRSTINNVVPSETAIQPGAQYQRQILNGKAYMVPVK